MLKDNVAAPLRAIFSRRLEVSKETQASQEPTDCQAFPATKASRESTANRETMGFRDSRDFQATPAPEVSPATKDSKGCQGSPVSQAHRDVQEIVVLRVVPPGPEATSSPGTVKLHEFRNAPGAPIRSGLAILSFTYSAMRKPTAKTWEVPEAACGDSARCHSCSAA